MCQRDQLRVELKNELDGFVCGPSGVPRKFKTAH